MAPIAVSAPQEEPWFQQKTDIFHSPIVANTRSNVNPMNCNTQLSLSFMIIYSANLSKNQ